MNYLTHLITPTRTIVFFLMVSVLSVVGYVVCIQQSVEQVVLRREKEQAISSMRTEVSTLESRYIKETKNINADLAAAMGYTKPVETIYLSRTTLGQNTITPRE